MTLLSRPIRLVLAAVLLVAGVGVPGPHSAWAAPSDSTPACSLLLRRLPAVNLQQCKAAQLTDSGGRSRLGRPLYWRDIAAGSGVAAKQRGGFKTPRVLVIGAIHGDELTAASLAFKWIALARQQSRGVHWRFVPVLNPDGLLAKTPTRTNAAGVDLNRNFHTTDWEQDALRLWKQRTGSNPRRWPGTSPLSEPESKFVHEQIASFEPHLVVSIHAPYGVLDFDGPDPAPQRLGSLRLHQVGVFPGSLGNYGGLQQGLPVVTIELPHATRMPADAQVRAMWQDLLRWMDAHLPAREGTRAAWHQDGARLLQ